MFKVSIEKIQGDTSKNLVHSNVAIRQGQYGYFQLKKAKSDADKEWEFVPLGLAIFVREIRVTMETLSQVDVLYFDTGGDRIVVDVPRGKLCEPHILELYNLGVQVSKKTAPYLLQSIENQEAKAPRLLEHQSLGFDTWKGKTIFKGHNAIGVQSRYNGNLRIEPTGDYETWKKMVESQVMGVVPLETILAIGATGVLVDFLKNDINVENIVVHLVGESSSGKSSAAMLLSSLGCCPSENNSLVFNFSDTFNSLMKSIESSFPAVIDEGSLVPNNKDVSAFLYSLSSGNEKRRLNTSDGVKEPNHFHTCIVTTSEKSLLQQSNQNNGLRVRSIEIEGVTWTTSASNSDIIKSTIKDNYGFVIPMIAEFLLRVSKEKLIAQLNKEVEIIIAKLKNENHYNKFSDRVSKQYALIMLAVCVLNHVLDLKFHKKEIRNFLLEHSLVNDEEQASIGMRAMDFLKSFVSKNILSFITDTTASDGVSNCRGRLKKTPKVLLKTGEESTMKLLISKTEMERIFFEGKFSDSKVVLREFRDLGYLICEKDRLVSDVKILDNIQVKGYCIQLPTVSEFKTINRDKISQKTEDEDFHPIDEYNPFEDDEENKKDSETVDEKSIVSSTTDEGEEEKVERRVVTKHLLNKKPCPIKRPRFALRKHEEIEEDDEDDEEIKGLTAEQNEERIRRVQEKIRENRKDYQEREEQDYEYVER